MQTKQIEFIHPHSVPRVGIAIIIVKDNKYVLMGKRKGSHGSGCWQLPGGHLEKNESWEQCAIRETLEETNLKVTKTKFLHVTNDIFENEDKHYITIFLKAIEWEGIPKVMEPNKVESWEWIEWNKGLPSPLFLPLNNLIKDGISPI